jgi:hypothetical protein
VHAATGISVEDAIAVDDEKSTHKIVPKRTKKRSESIGPKQATLDIYSTKAETKSPALENRSRGSLSNQNGHVQVETLEEDLNLDRRKRQRTASPAGKEITTQHNTAKVEAVHENAPNGTLTWYEQLRIEADKSAHTESDAASIQKVEEQLVPAVHIQQPAENQDPAEQLLDEVRTQSEHASRASSVFSGTKWTAEQPEQSNDEASKPLCKCIDSFTT